MGINLKAMREKYNTLRSRGGGKDIFWRPQDGEQTVRLVPVADGRLAQVFTKKFKKMFLII